MDLKQEILKEHSKSNTLRITQYIGNDPKKFKELMNLFLGPEYRVTQRAAWIMSYCATEYPKLIKPYLKKIILNLRKEVPPAVKRNTVRVLQHIEIPKALLGETADICFKFLETKNEPVAVKVFSMTILANICKKEPDLKNELKLLIEDQMPYGSSGFKSRGRKILGQIQD